MLQHQSCQLWKLSSNNATYKRYYRMLSGELQNVVDVNKLNISLLSNNSNCFKDKPYALILHDPSDIRKPHSQELDSLCKVRDLSGNLVNGYRTFNSVGVEMNRSNIHLLQNTPYSTEDALYVKHTDRDKEEKLGTSGYFNQKSIFKSHIQSIDSQIKSVSPDCQIVDILDREFDDKEVFEYLSSKSHLFVIRCKTNRKGTEYELDEFGKEKQIKLSKQFFMNGFEKSYQKIKFKSKVYQDVKGVFEYSPISIEDKPYHLVRVSFYTRKGHRVFKEPMLLITNMVVDNEQITELVYEMYLQRSKIEAVFKFCKDVMGWESPRVADFECFKNILSFVFFLTGYFYEIEHELIKKPEAIILAEMGNGKGKVTPYYILLGLKKLIDFIQIKQLVDKQNLTVKDIENITQMFVAQNL